MLGNMNIEELVQALNYTKLSLDDSADNIKELEKKLQTVQAKRELIETQQKTLTIAIDELAEAQKENVSTEGEILEEITRQKNLTQNLIDQIEQFQGQINTLR